MQGGEGWRCSPNWSPDLLLLFVCGNRLFRASPSDNRAQQPSGILRVVGNVPQRSATATGRGSGKGWANTGDNQTGGNGPGLLTLAHAAPDVAHHRQAGKKETRVNQHGEQDLQDGKHQEGQVKVTVHYVKTQFFTVLG